MSVREPRATRDEASETLVVSGKSSRFDVESCARRGQIYLQLSRWLRSTNPVCLAPSRDPARRLAVCVELLRASGTPFSAAREGCKCPSLGYVDD